MKRQPCNNKHRRNEFGQRPCTQPVVEQCSAQVREECQCQEERREACSPEEHRMKICGKVTFNGRAISGATVVIMHDRRVVAECITDREGCFEFKGKHKCYSLRAHKGNRRSSLHTIKTPCDKHEVNFRLR